MPGALHILVSCPKAGKEPRRAYYYTIRFPPCFFFNLYCRSSHNAYSTVSHETRLTENGKPLEPHLRRPIATSFFFRFHLGFWANHRRFTPTRQRSRPCASRNEFPYSPTGTQCENPLLHRCSSNSCWLAKIWLKKSEKNRSSIKSKNRPNFWRGTGQLQIVFRRIMHRGQKLELLLWRSGFFSSVPLGCFGLLWIGSQKCMAGWFPQLIGQKRTWTQKKKSKSNGIESDPNT